MASQLQAKASDGTQVLLQTRDSRLASQRASLVQAAAQLHIPALYEDRIYVDAGGSMSFGPDVRAMHRRAADYVDKILKGAKPSEMPIEQATRFQLVINKRTADAMGFTIPKIVMLQPDEIIE